MANKKDYLARFYDTDGNLLAKWYHEYLSDPHYAARKAIKAMRENHPTLAPKVANLEICDNGVVVIDRDNPLA